MIVTAEIAKMTGLVEGIDVEISSRDIHLLRRCMKGVEEGMREVEALTASANMRMASIKGLLELMSETVAKSGQEQP